MNGYPDCRRCGHDFHGLPCSRMTSPLATGLPELCRCPSAFDDDYWDDGDAA